MKQCSKCKETKPFAEFFKRKISSDGYHYYCKQCANVACKKVRSREEWILKWRDIRKKRQERFQEIKASLSCKVCGEPSSQEICQTCKIVEGLKKKNVQ